MPVVITILRAAGPYMLAGFFPAGPFRAFVPTEAIVKLLGKSNLASVLGVAPIGVPRVGARKAVTGGPGAETKRLLKRRGVDSGPERRPPLFTTTRPGKGAGPRWP